jgi:glycyl-tRNA synthetase beta chain
MTDFLLELRSEEIPARMQAGARAALEKLFREQMQAAGVALGAITVWSTPRRLALIARDMPESTEAVSEELKGPKTSAPPQALEGFLRKTGLTQDQLTERDGIYFAVTEKPGRATKDVLAEAIPAIVRAFPWPKSQRWGAASISTESLRWVRPLSGIVAILGEELVETEVGGIQSGYATKGHRFHHPDAITFDGAHDYRDKLRLCHVIVDHEERQDLIRAKAAEAAQAAGLTLVPDEGLVIENAGLTEWPVPLLGRFDEAFLEVPPEVIQLTARTNQKYFVCTYPPQNGEGDHAKHGGGGSPATPPSADSPLHRPADGPPPRAGEDLKLANAFVCTANIEASDLGAAIVDGNRKVIAARLSDARFFWEQDRKKSLAQHAEGLARITFHEKLGTVADKVERVAKLARWLVETGVVGNTSPERGGGPLPQAGVEGSLASSANAARRTDAADPTTTGFAGGPPPRSGEVLGEVAQLADLAEQAARLCKADLVTEMVGEFPELQGLMGGYYARAEGLPDAVADAICDHYKPVGQGDDVPTAPVTVAVSLADKLDTLFSFWFLNEKPTGSKDPFALRRASLGILAVCQANSLRFSVREMLTFALAPWMDLSSPTAKFEGEAGTQFSIDEMLNNEGHSIRLRHKKQWMILGELENRSVEEFVRFEIYPALVLKDISSFFADRLKVQQREAGVRHDLIDAVFALGGEDDLVRLLARVHALQAFIGSDDGKNLHAGYKRAANILKKEDWQGIEGEIPVTGEEDPLAQVDDPDLAPVIAAKMAERHANALSYTPEPAEKALMDALDSAGPTAEAAVDAEDFGGAMAALATLRAPIDAFFDTVTVNDVDADKRRARLGLLARFRDAVHGVADFSRIEG